MDKYFKAYNRKTNLCECSHWRHEHFSKRSWIMGVLFDSAPGPCRAKSSDGENTDCQCEGFVLHIPLRDKGRNNE